MAQLIECVPNFSEGRDQRTVLLIRDSILSAAPVTLADFSCNADHNRSVFTLIGTAENIEASIMAAVRTAVEQIDMNHHVGCHPCIGAADVIPFIPLQNCSMADCVKLSTQIAERIAVELNLPVYLYGQSARVTAHQKLADLRRGGFAALQQSIATNPQKYPDFGPACLGRAGASAVGARPILIAWNVYLNSNNLSNAKTIARQIRGSSGGMRGVQALGMAVNGYAQVSMNIVDVKAAPMQQVFDVIEKCAAALDKGIHHSELIGLLPREAMQNTSPEALKLIDFSEKRFIESYL